MKNKIICLCLMVGLSFFCGCKDEEKHLHCRNISKDQVNALKTIIIEEGYKRISKENYPYEGAISTQYSKKLSKDGTGYSVIIILSFKAIENTPDAYRNLGIWIEKNNGKDMPEINTEIERIESILYNKLVELTGTDNVVKGWPKESPKASVK